MMKCSDLIEDVKHSFSSSASSSTFRDKMWSIQKSVTFQKDEPIPPDYDLCHRCCKTERGKRLLESRRVQLEKGRLWTESHWSRSPYCSASPTEETRGSSDCRSWSLNMWMEDNNISIWDYSAKHSRGKNVNLGPLVGLKIKGYPHDMVIAID